MFSWRLCRNILQINRIQKVKDILNVFMETMPEYPIDKEDTEGKGYI